MDRIGISFEFVKSRSTGRHVRGWASVVEVDGEPVVDWDGDRYENMDVLRKAAHDFIRDERVAKAQHKGTQIGDVVGAIIIDDEFCKAIGATTTKRGLWIDMDITDEAVQKDIRDGKFTGFSVGGKARKVDA